jgi:hypothetical protein
MPTMRQTRPPVGLGRVSLLPARKSIHSRKTPHKDVQPQQEAPQRKPTNQPPDAAEPIIIIAENENGFSDKTAAACLFSQQGPLRESSARPSAVPVRPSVAAQQPSQAAPHTPSANAKEEASMRPQPVRKSANVNSHKTDKHRGGVRRSRRRPVRRVGLGISSDAFTGDAKEGVLKRTAKEKRGRSCEDPTPNPKRKRDDAGCDLESVEDLVGAVVRVPASVFSVHIPDLYYVADVVGPDRSHENAVDVVFREDGSVYWFPAADVRSWLGIAHPACGETDHDEFDPGCGDQDGFDHGVEPNNYASSSPGMCSTDSEEETHMAAEVLAQISGASSGYYAERNEVGETATAGHNGQKVGVGRRPASRFKPTGHVIN